MLGALVLVLTLAVLAPVASAATDYERAVALEHQGRIAQAASALTDAKLAGGQARHAADIRAAAAALAAASVYQDAGEEGAAERALTKTLGQLDPARDPYLVLALERRLGDVRDEGIAAEVGHTAERAATTVGEWLGLALLVLAVPLLLWLAFRWALGRISPRAGVSIALDDLAAEPAARAEASQMLGHQLTSALSGGRTASANTSATELDVSTDLDGGMALNARVEGASLNALEPAAGAGTVVALGPVSVPLRQLTAVAAAAFRRPSQHQLRGHLYSDGEKTALDVALYRPDTDAPIVQWSVVHGGDGARRRAVAEAASRLRFELAGSSVTRSWPSLAAYQEGCSLLAEADASPDREAALLGARGCFERALTHDQTNARARFDLGNVLRRLGHNEDAAAQMLFLEGQLEGREDSSSVAIRRASRYGRAVALSKIWRWEEHKAAEVLLRDLCAELDASTGDDARERERLAALALSALAATLVFKVAKWQGNEAAAERRDKVLAEIAELRKRLQREATADQAEDWVTYSYARAVAENAYGRAAYLSHDRSAIDAFERALSLMPDYGDAHINLALALSSGRSSADKEQRALRHLERALEISPWNTTANYLLGEQYRKVGNVEEAARAYAKAGDDARALFALARLAWEAGDSERAGRYVRRSFGCDPAPNWRTWDVVQWAVRARRQGLADEGLADQALDAGRRMRKELRTQGETMKPQLERWLAELQTSPAKRGNIIQPLRPPAPAPVPAADDDASAPAPSAHGDHSTPPPAADGEKAGISGAVQSAFKGSPPPAASRQPTGGHTGS